jgi:hypothetical protein
MAPTTQQSLDVGRPRKDDEPTVQVAFRLPESIVKALDEVAKDLSPPGITISRTDVLRVLLFEALTARGKTVKQRKK